MNPNFPDALPAGTTLSNGAFVLDDVLGQGGFGITYRGRDLNLGREVAIKEFFPLGSTRRNNDVQPASLALDEYSQARTTFLEEARTLARFSHPGIVDVYTVFGEKNSAYMVMELLRGQPLSRMVETRGALPVNEALDIIERAGDALEVVHGAGLLHGDLKPDNIMACDDGRVVLIDFSLSKELEAESGLSTRRFAGSVRSGTPGYAPPEQYGRTTPVGTYTDVYALAATLYHLLTAQTPIEATDRAAGTPLPDIRQFNPQVNNRLASAINGAMSMEPRNRPQTARTFLTSLDEASTQASTQMSAPAPTAPQRPAPQRSREDDFDDEDEYARRRPRTPEEELERQLEELLDPFGARRAPQPPPQFPPQQYPQTPFPPQRQRFPQRFPQRGPGGFRIIGCGPCGCMTLFILFFLLQLLGAIFSGFGGSDFIYVPDFD
jgi:serine/threonine protein kinase